MKVLLTTLNAKYIHTNLAIRLLYELNKDHKNLHWKEFTIKEDPEKICDYLSSYDIIAFSCYIWNITATLHVIKELKQKHPHVKVLLGGPEVSYEYDNVIALPEIDYIICGEGEIPFNEFLNSYPTIEHIPGLVYKKDGIIKTNPLPPQFDISKHEDIMPYASDEPSTLWNKVLYIETSRGCPYKCEFCLASLDNKVRYLPDKHIKTTLLYMMEHGRVIKFLDRTFNMKKTFTLDIFEFILKHHKPHNVFQFEITADILHPDIIAYINQKVPKNLFRFEIGIQTVNQKANLEVSRKQNFEKTKSIIKQVEDKVELHLDLIVGLPLDYYSDIKFSFEEVFNLFAPELQLGFLKLLKGTPVREKHEQHGFKYDPLPPYQLIESNYLSKEEIQSIMNLEHMLEIYWNSKKTIYTLRYIATTYSIFDFLLGLSKAFEARLDFHKFSLEDAFTVLFDHATTVFPEDQILQELIALDYYLHFKSRPKQLFVNDMEKEPKNEVLKKLNIETSGKRFVVLPVNFELEQVISGNSKINGENFLVIGYNGTDKAELMHPVL